MNMPVCDVAAYVFWYIQMYMMYSYIYVHVHVHVHGYTVCRSVHIA